MSQEMNIRILHKDILLNKTLGIEDSQVNLNYPLDNLKLSQLSKTWRSADNNKRRQIISDLAPLLEVDGFVLAGHNLGVLSQVTLKLFTAAVRDNLVTNAVWTNPDLVLTLQNPHNLVGPTNISVYFDENFDDKISGGFNSVIRTCTVIDANTLNVSTTDNPYWDGVGGGTVTSLNTVYEEIMGGLGAQDPLRYSTIHTFFTPVFTDYLLVDIDGTDATGGYIEAGRMMLGTSFSPRLNMGWEASITYQSLSTLQRSRHGGLYSENRNSYRVAAFRFDYLSEAEGITMLDMMDYPGRSSDSFVSMYPEDTGDLGDRTSILGRFVSHSPLVRSQWAYGMSFVFEEGL